MFTTNALLGRVINVIVYQSLKRRHRKSETEAGHFSRCLLCLVSASGFRLQGVTSTTVLSTAEMAQSEAMAEAGKFQRFETLSTETDKPGLAA